MHQRQVHPGLVQELVELNSICPEVAAASMAQYRSIITAQLEIYPQGAAGMTELQAKIVRQGWIPFMHESRIWRSAVAFVPYIFIKEDVIKDNGDVAVEIFPCIPSLEVLRFFVKVNERNGREILHAETTLGDHIKVYIAHSGQYRGPLMSGVIDSELGVIIQEYRDLVKLETLTIQAYVEASKPTTYLQQYPPGPHDGAAALSTLAVDVDRQTGQLSSQEVTTFGEKPKLMRLGSYKDIVKDLLKGELCDPIDNAVFVPRGHCVATQPRLPSIPADLSERRAMFASHVASSLQVPESFLTSARTGSSINGQQTTLASDNDRIRFKFGVEALQEDLLYILKQVHDQAHDHALTSFKLPVASHVDFEAICLLYEKNVISKSVFDSEAARSVGLHHTLTKAHGSHLP
jgi:hypothetical protein